MQKTVMKNSKKGFSLPMAIAVSLFLIIISTSLLFISIQSMSTTTVDISGRQAYLNVKSALEYAHSYYSTHVTDYSKIGSAQYMIINQGDDISKGAKIETDTNKLYAANTYVMAVYKKGEGSNKSTLTLTAFSKYSDAYGNKSKVARLSVTYTIGASGPNRLTIIGTTPTSQLNISTESITLNVKKPKSMEDDLYAYYVWTYKDAGNAYSGFYKSTNNISSFDWDEKVIKANGWIDRLNTSTLEKIDGVQNLVEPNDKWATGNSGKLIPEGPQGMFSDTGNGWFAGEYVPKSEYVPWINVMFAKHGSVLKGSDNKASNIYDSQSNEMLHLWYLDPSDKNIYFEFLGTPKNESIEHYPFEISGKSYITKYYEGKQWDGKKGLDDTIVVYVKNPKTTVHLRVKGMDDTNLSTSISDPEKYPKIKKVVSKDGDSISGPSYIGNGTRQSENIPMAYEGCGWWVANVETNKTFDITFTVGLVDYKAYAVDANSVSNEFWFVVDEDINPHMTEESALAELGVDPNSYVTIHAKSSEYATRPTPRLIYSNPGIESTTEQIDLLNQLLKATQLVEKRYTAESFKAVKAAKKAGFALIDQEDFIDSQVGPSDAEKIQQADEKYRQAKQDLLDAIANLKNVTTTIADMATLVSYVNQGKYAETVQASKGEFDKDAFKAFIGSAENQTYYYKAKAAVADPKSVTLDEVSTLETGLNNDLTALRAKRLNRQLLSIAIDSYTAFENLSGVYEDEYQSAFNSAMTDARAALTKLETTQSELDTALNTLDTAKSNLDAHAKTVLDFTRINALRDLANAYLSGEKKNCTDDTYNALQAAFDKATIDAPKKTKQADVDDIADELETAYNNFYIQKPAGSIDELKKNNVIRLWIVNKCTDETVSFYVDKYALNSGSTTREPFENMHLWGPATGLTTYRYTDLALTDCDRIVVTTTKDAVPLKSTPEIKLDTTLDTLKDYNLCVVIAENGDISTTKLVSVYGIFDGDEVKGKIGTETIVSSYDEPYYCFRYPVTDDNKESQFNVVNKHNSIDGSPDPFEVYNAGKIETPGDYIIKGTLNAETNTTTTTLTNVMDVYPKYSEGSKAPEEPTAGPTLANDGDIQIGELIATDRDYVFFTDNDYDGWHAGNTPRAHFWKEGGTEYDSWPGNKMSFYKTNDMGESVYKIQVPDGANRVIFNTGGVQTVNVELEKGCGYYKDGWQDGKMKVGKWNEKTDVSPASDYAPFESTYIYVKNNYNWNNLHICFRNNDNTYAPMPGFSLDFAYNDTDGKAVFKITPPQGAKYFSINNGDTGTKSLETVYTLGHHYRISGGSGSVHELEDMDASSGTTDISGGGGTYDEPGYAETDLGGEDCTMRYVGGNKVRIINQSYTQLFGNSKKNHFNVEINDDNKFGGSNMNEDSGGRLGYSKLVPYYDWFEYKIPVSVQASYDFTIVGLCSESGKTDVQTKIVEKARGNVWLELLSTNNSGGGHFQNYNIYTFDPEESQIGDTLNIYFRLPYVDTEEHPDYVTWKNPEVTFGGPFVDKLGDYDHSISTALTRTGNTNIFVYKGIQKNNPFLTFTVVGPDRDDPTVSKTYQYKTCFQGGDFVLFDPSLNDNYGGWEEFVSDQERLKRAVNLLRSTYYGCKIISEYDSDGAQSFDAFYTYSDGLMNLYKQYSTEYTAGTTYYVNNNYDDQPDTWCYNEAVTINNYVAAARKLYSAMSESKQYINKPLTGAESSFHGADGGVYPEYRYRTVKNRKYTKASTDAIRGQLKDAESVYAANSTIEQMNSKTNAIMSAIAGMEVSGDESIGIVFYDCQNKVDKGSKFQIRYTLEQNSTAYKSKDVTEYNPEMFPIKFIEPSDIENNDTIYNVSFRETEKDGNVIDHLELKVMKMDEAWVFMDQSGAPMWRKNALTDYREIKAEVFQMVNTGSKQEYVMKPAIDTSSGDKYETMTLLFTKDAWVEACTGATFASYMIKAGSYFFNDDNAGLFKTEGVVDLFTQEARTYFTNDDNIGYYTVGKPDLNGNAVDVVTNGSDWINSDIDDFKTGANSVHGYVNFAAKQGSFTRFTPYYGLESDSGIFFRWDTTSPLYLSSTVKMVGSEFKFASMGVLDGTKTRTPHFYLIPNDSSMTSMYVEFRTDLYVKYIDKKGNKRQFTIREGKYEIKKPKTQQTRSYMADLFDETYWKGMEDITYISRYTFNGGGSGTSGSGTSGSLNGGTYSN